MFDFRTPFFLILLIAIPVLIFVQRQAHRGTTQWRKNVTFFFRGAALLCAILALASLHRTHKEQRLAVVFLIDTSESVQPIQREETVKQINAAVAKLKPTDLFGIIGFGKETSVLTGIRQKQNQPLESMSAALLASLAEQAIRRDGTDILTALKHAIASLPDDYHRRIVLFSDGIHNAGGTRLEDYLPLLSASNVEIAAIPLNTLKDAVRVVQLQVPTQVHKGQRFEMRAIIETDGNLPKVPATLYHEGALIDTFEWTLPNGTHSLSLPVPPVSEERNHRYELKLDVRDEILENNQGYGVVKIQGKPHILYVDEDPTQVTHLKTVLQENGFDVEVRAPMEMPTDLIELKRSDVLILSNVSVDVLSLEHLQSIENYVRDLGHGLIVIGGGHAYGPGGYTDTALERVLPVKMTPREQKDTVAILFVLDTSGSMANYVGGQRRKIDLAIAGISAGIDNLEEDDIAGVISFSAGKDAHIVSYLTSDRPVLLQAVGRLKPTGGTTLMMEAIDKASEILEADDAKRKHIVLLSDGKSDDTKSDFLKLAEQIAKARISITAIAIGDANVELLTQLTENVVRVKNVQELPKVLTEAVRETQRYIVQEPFQPVINVPSESIVEGIGTPPELHGYVATAGKDTAQVFIRSHKDEPVLAGWNIGLGKAVAWTSDVKAWAKEWIPWRNFGKFWGQSVNWVLPVADADADFDLTVSLRHGAAEVSIDTRTPSQVAYEVRAAGPSGTSEAIEMQQMTLTRHNGTFQIHDSGSYIVTAQREGDGSKRTKPLILPYPSEYAEFEVNTDLLKTLASETGGTYEPTPTQIASPAGIPIEKQISLAHALLIAAALFFVLEMILRRYSIANRHIAEFLGRLRGQPADKSVGGQVDTAPSPERVTGNTVSVEPTEASMTRLLAAKRRAR
ncbi:VWA domain-containing protein [Candidatus Poribacteria bacterium]|nr:VWA domain-containing protein [Candidatus Poribacteria bacterium]MYB00946.1 VWA domain-containing protein [Candidatus Poribacteria bacterium]